MCRGHVSVMVLLLVSLSAATASDLTPEERRAEYLQNALQAKTLRVRWSWSRRRTGAEEKYNERRMQIVRRELEAGRYPKDKAPQAWERVKRFESDEERERARISATLDMTFDADYWSDRNRVQFRTPGSGAKASKPFPDLASPLNQNPEAFVGFTVLSGGLEGGQWRLMLHTGEQGAIESSNPHGHSSSCHCPPLALPEPAWVRDWRNIHNLDRFFMTESRLIRDEGETTLDGVFCHAITGVFPSLNGDSDALIMRVFVPSGVASIPVRLELLHYPEDETQTLADLDWLPIGKPVTGKTHPNLGSIVRDVVVEEVEPGFFYPVHGFVDHYGRTPDHDTYEWEGLPVVVYETREWRAHQVEANRPMTEEMFAFEFPPGTLIRDGLTEDAYVVDPDGYANRITAGWVKPPSAQKDSSWFWWLLSFCGVTIAAATAFLVLRRRRRSV